MKHEPVPGGPDWEPPWMSDMRKIEASVREQIDRYCKARRWDMLRWFYGGMLGYWVGFGTAELLKWWVGLK